MPSKAIAVDSLSRCRIVVLGIFFYVLFFVGLGIGLSGPKRLDTKYASIARSPQPLCDAVCVVALEAKVSDLTPLKQFLSVQLELSRPESSDGKPLQFSYAVEADISFSVDMLANDGSGAILSKNQTHSRHFSWAPGQTIVREPMTANSSQGQSYSWARLLVST
jgi:hypothetical protein